MEHGRHAARVNDVYVETLEDGREIIKVGFVVTYEGVERGLEATVWLTDKALGIAYARMRSIGFDIKVRDLAEFAKNPFLLQGNTCEIELGEYNGRPQVTWFGQPKQTLKPSALTSLTKRIRAAVNDAGQDHGVTTAPDPVKAVANVEEEPEPPF